LSKGFDAIPQVELMELSWMGVRNPDAVREHGLSVDEGDRQEAGEKVWVALLNCDVLNATSYSNANERANALKRTLESEAGVRVDVVSYPFNTLSGAELKEEDVGAKMPARLPFKLRVVWKRS